jgi:type IV pilus assembly protein PilQ
MNNQWLVKTMLESSFMNLKKIFLPTLTVCVLFVSLSSLALANELKSLEYSSLSNGKLDLIFTFSTDIKEPESFTIDEPSRIVVDFADVTNGLDKKTENINLGPTKSVSVVEAGDRTRAVINLSEKTNYSLFQESNRVIISINGATQDKSLHDNLSQIEIIDFKCGANGEG